MNPFTSVPKIQLFAFYSSIPNKVTRIIHINDDRKKMENYFVRDYPPQIILLLYYYYD